MTQARRRRPPCELSRLWHVMVVFAKSEQSLETPLQVVDRYGCKTSGAGTGAGLCGGVHMSCELPASAWENLGSDGYFRTAWKATAGDERVGRETDAEHAKKTRDIGRNLNGQMQASHNTYLLLLRNRMVSTFRNYAHCRLAYARCVPSLLCTYSLRHQLAECSRVAPRVSTMLQHLLKGSLLAASAARTTGAVSTEYEMMSSCFRNDAAASLYCSFADRERYRRIAERGIYWLLKENRFRFWNEGLMRSRAKS
eukprot:2927012-Pleurochrysis_carterae.AAC.1